MPQRCCFSRLMKNSAESPPRETKESMDGRPRKNRIGKWLIRKQNCRDDRSKSFFSSLLEVMMAVNAFPAKSDQSILCGTGLISCRNNIGCLRLLHGNSGRRYWWPEYIFSELLWHCAANNLGKFFGMYMAQLCEPNSKNSPVETVLSSKVT